MCLMYLCVAGLVLNECRRESMCLMYLCVAGLVLNECRRESMCLMYLCVAGLVLYQPMVCTRHPSSVKAVASMQCLLL